MRGVVAIVLLGLLCAAPSEAKHHLEIVPLVGLRTGGSITVEDRAFHRDNIEVGMASSASLGLHVALPVTERLAIEGIFSHQSTTFMDQNGLFGETPGGFFAPGDRSFLDVEITSYAAGALWKLHRGWSEIYLVMGGGISKISPSLDLPETSQLSMNGGGGVAIRLDERLGLRTEWRTYWTHTDDTIARVTQYEDRDCIDPCTYTYRYRPNLIQGELSMGLALSF